MIKAHPFKTYKVCYEQVLIFIRKLLYEQHQQQFNSIKVQTLIRIKSYDSGIPLQYQFAIMKASPNKNNLLF